MPHLHQLRRLSLRLQRLGQVQVHLVAVKIRIVRRADALVEAEGAVGENVRLVRHDGQFVQGGLAVEQDEVAVLHVSLHLVAHLQLRRHGAAVAEQQGPHHAIGLADLVGAGVGGPIQH